MLVNYFNQASDKKKQS